MKKLTITYGDQTLCDTDQVAQFSFAESKDGLSVTAKFDKPTRDKARPAGLAELIAAAGKSKQKPEVIEESD